MRRAMGLPGRTPMSWLRRGAFALAAARISTNGSNRSLGSQSRMSHNAANVRAGIRSGVPVISRWTWASAAGQTLSLG
jgi:hypothetical protein